MEKEYQDSPKDLEDNKLSEPLAAYGMEAKKVCTYLEPDNDFNRAISMEQFKDKAKEHIRKLYKNKSI
ncbi:MAG: hypothetical protein LUH15_02875 [Tannerellaceae bacterium]|nr:hypothetical protein [Tannerellaceae bacterium]